jgi:hypothetical protein
VSAGLPEGLGVGVGVGEAVADALVEGIGDVGACGVPPPPLQPLATSAPRMTNG